MSEMKNSSSPAGAGKRPDQRIVDDLAYRTDAKIAEAAEKFAEFDRRRPPGRQSKSVGRESPRENLSSKNRIV